MPIHGIESRGPVKAARGDAAAALNATIAVYKILGSRLDHERAIHSAPLRGIVNVTVVTRIHIC